MKKTLIILAIILPLAVGAFLIWPHLSGVSENDADMIGTWQGKEPTGSTVKYNPKTEHSWFYDDVTFVFNEDGSFARMEDGKNDEWGEDGRVLKWKTNNEEIPAQIDIVILDNTGQEMRTLRGIYRFIDDEKKMMAIQFNKSLTEYSTSDLLLQRPTDFDPDKEIVLTRN